MQTKVPARWKSGVANEAWKVHIASRDAARARDLMGGLAYILAGGSFERASHSIVDQAAFVGQFSGQAIAAALLDFHDKSLAAIELGMGQKTEQITPNQGDQHGS